MFERLVDAYPDSVQLVYRHFPLNSIHDQAHLASQAAEAAGAQGQFWEFQKALYESQQDWSGMEEADFRGFLEDMAADLGLDVTQFNADLDNETYAAYVSDLEQEAMNIGLPGTPSVILNGELLPQVPFEYEVWDQFVGAQVEFARIQEQLADIQYDAPPEMSIDPDASYQATVNLDNGESFVMELYPQSAPVTVNNFIFLANEGWFDDVMFHRVIPGFMAQTGDPTGTGMGGPGYSIVDEFDPELTFDAAGVLAMANSGPDTGGSQWFITYDATPHLNGLHTIFGRVIEGMDVVEAIIARDPQDPNAPDGVRIESIEIEEQ
ncbi:MAG TPA: hypothetical protein EYP41_10480 [Anaerolineae bacterium]|nr:hypothetical protein [Anaerolineae bacterium]